MRPFSIVIVLAVMGARSPSSAQDLAEQCREMSLKAHPASLPDIPSVVNLRNDYYQLCMDRRGVMDPELASGKQ